MRDLLGRYGLADEVADLYPFELSGGMARRVLLLTALMRQPRLIIADEPTPGMDLALAKQAMQDFRTFADDGNGVLLITHDLELALEVADRIVVFYGRDDRGGSEGDRFCGRDAVAAPIYESAI